MLKSTGKIQISGGMALKAYVPHSSTTEEALDVSLTCFTMLLYKIFFVMQENIVLNFLK